MPQAAACRSGGNSKVSHCVHASAGGSIRLWELGPGATAAGRWASLELRRPAGRHACMWYGARPGKDQIRSTNQVVLAVSGTQQGGDEKHDDGALSLSHLLAVVIRTATTSEQDTTTTRVFHMPPNDESAEVLQDSRPDTPCRRAAGSKSNSIPWNCLALASAFAVMRTSTFVSFFIGARANQTRFGKKLRPRIQPAWDSKCNKL